MWWHTNAPLSVLFNQAQSIPHRVVGGWTWERRFTDGSWACDECAAKLFTLVKYKSVAVGHSEEPTCGIPRNEVAFEFVNSSQDSCDWRNETGIHQQHWHAGGYKNKEINKMAVHVKGPCAITLPEATKSPFSKWMATAAISGLLLMFTVEMSALESHSLRAIPHWGAPTSLKLRLTLSSTFKAAPRLHRHFCALYFSCPCTFALIYSPLIVSFVWQTALQSRTSRILNSSAATVRWRCLRSSHNSCLSTAITVSSSHIRRISQLLRSLLIQTNCSGNNTLNI